MAEQQLVEIAKSLNRKTRILIMDEPSAVLGEKDLEKLFKVVRSLQAQGIGIIYISHRLREIFELADEVTVLKDGRYVATRHVAEVTMDDLVRLMIGRDLKDVYPKRQPKLGEVLLEVKSLAPHQARPRHLLQAPRRRDRRLRRHHRLRPHRGGARHLRRRPAQRRDASSPASRTRPARPPTAIARGIALVTEDRKAQGLFLKQNVTVNTTISGLKQLCRAGPHPARARSSPWCRR